jgi:CDP-6-deoxy-D-xylo-4-hexulose-3-dehydrase
LKKLPGFIEARKQNWETLRVGLSDLEDVFNFTLPTHAASWVPPEQRTGADFASSFRWDGTGCRSDSSWFGFMLRVKPQASFTHTDLARHLDEKKIGNRMFFGGNLLRQPVFVQLRKDRPDAICLIGSHGSPLTPVTSETIGTAFAGADSIMKEAIFLGTYPGLTKEMLAYEISVIRDFVKSKRT